MNITQQDMPFVSKQNYRDDDVKRHHSSYRFNCQLPAWLIRGSFGDDLLSKSRAAKANFASAFRKCALTLCCTAPVGERNSKADAAANFLICLKLLFPTDAVVYMGRSKSAYSAYCRIAFAIFAT